MYVDLALPPGVLRTGTMRQSQGRWYDANLVRWYENALRPMGGWQSHSSNLAGAGARAILGWTDNNAARWTAIGTPTKLWVYKRDGSQYDITPSGLTAGHVDATSGGGYGTGTYGTGVYGIPRPDTTLILDCTVWTLDTFGQYLVACNADDGKVYEWKLNTATIAAPLPSTVGAAPIANRAVMVTGEGFIFVLGAGGNPRLVQWPDQRTDGTWTPGPTNQAGFYQLQTQGRIMCGKRIRGGELIFTDQDVHLATYLGAPLVYGFEQVGSGCGITSQAAAAVTGDGTAYWMAKDGFWSYNGTISPLESEVGDYVFGRLNASQRSKVFAVHNPSFGEVDWYYPSVSSTEIDSYVRFNYRESHWSIGSLVRTCGIEAGSYQNYPLLVDASGQVWEHESGYASYGGAQPYAETGPLEVSGLGSLTGSAFSAQALGANVMHILGMIPDSLTLADATMMFYGRFYPNAAETTYGPYSASDPTDLRMTGRQFRLRYNFTPGVDGRIGVPRLDIRPGGGR